MVMIAAAAVLLSASTTTLTKQATRNVKHGVFILLSVGDALLPSKRDSLLPPDLDGCHQAVVLVLEDVAMKHVTPDLLRRIEAHHDKHSLEWRHWNGVVPLDFFARAPDVIQLVIRLAAIVV